MRRALTMLCFILVAAPALAATAFWTGKQRPVRTVTYQIAWNCQYHYKGQLFWRIFKNSCPASVPVE
jgi:hypothetical protein